ncbi:hypothetical protein ACLE20_10020 [Rhizobium sp. YIM 134829]|uniref:hypothetical protein n=1 Tax=Rhizobium sp. YIM 134829 TaxID=3390453 RepID=UPI00397B233D
MTVTFKNVHKTLGRKAKKTLVFEGASAEIPGDRITGVLGAPRSGKSTMANLTIGKVRPDRGSVRRGSLVSFPMASGVVFNGSLTPRENLAFLCRVFGFDPVPIIRFVNEFTEAGKWMDKPMREVDRDTRTRLIFTAGYAIPFETYIVDENILGGRGEFRERCVELVAERMQTAGFIIYTSSPSLLKRYCTDFFVIDQHKIFPAETIDEAVARLGNDHVRDSSGEVDGIDETGEEVNFVSAD